MDWTFMDPRKSIVPAIIISILFALAIVLLSNIPESSGDGATVTYILIALWFPPFMWLLSMREQEK